MAEVDMAEVDMAESVPPLPTLHVVGIGLTGIDSLSAEAQRIVTEATLVVGAQRHLDTFARTTKEAQKPELWPLGNFSEVFAALRSHLNTYPSCRPVVLATGDPLFFGIGRLLLTKFPPQQLVFHPQVSAIQLAFSRLKVPWQDATLVSVHGRGEALLLQALKRGDEKIAVLTDGLLTPEAIAALIHASALPTRYQLWVCENLGGEHERISLHGAHASNNSKTDDSDNASPNTAYAALNVVVLLRQASEPAVQDLPLIGLPDSAFYTFADRPTLMTKREIRLLVLGAIAPMPNQIIWDIGAGTGSVSVELSRLCPSAQIYAVEKTAMGVELIRRNAQRYAIAPIHPIQGQAPHALEGLPKPSRIFIGGSGGQLTPILDFLHEALLNKSVSHSPISDSSADDARIVLALATIESLSEVVSWVKQPNVAEQWQYEMTQISIARSQPTGPLTRFSPLTPITLVTLRNSSP